jgi:hypothetical protein
MRLLDLSYFEPIFSPLSQVRIGLVDGVGNVGDILLQQATRQLLIAFELSWQTINPLADPPGCYEVDVLLLFAGGSMGGNQRSQAIRKRALQTKIPCIVLPQSFLAPERQPYQTVYIREPASRKHCPAGILMPDLALGYDFPTADPPIQDRGVFLRKSGRSLFLQFPKVDPAEFCFTPEAYISFAGQYQHIVTDRLHLAITALGLRRQVTLLPVGYHKNRSVWEAWLQDLGCLWADSLS